GSLRPQRPAQPRQEHPDAASLRRVRPHAYPQRRAAFPRTGALLMSVFANDASAQLLDQVNQALAAKTPLRIQGGGSKAFLGRPVEGQLLDVREHRGIVSYDPTELVITVRAGTPLAELEAVLDEAGQMLPCEPPHFGAGATVGGMIAAGVSGPRRPWSGSVRDFVLGTRIITRS